MREFEVEFEDGTSTTVHAEIGHRSEAREDDAWEHEFHTPHREGEPNAPEPGWSFECGRRPKLAACSFGPRTATSQTRASRSDEAALAP
jgi:hypothetical protein